MNQLIQVVFEIYKLLICTGLITSCVTLIWLPSPNDSIKSVCNTNVFNDKNGVPLSQLNCYQIYQKLGIISSFEFYSFTKWFTCVTLFILFICNLFSFMSSILLCIEQQYRSNVDYNNNAQLNLNVEAAMNVEVVEMGFGNLNEQTSEPVVVEQNESKNGYIIFARHPNC